MFRVILILFILCILFIYFFKGNYYSKENFSDEERKTIESNVAYLKAQVDNMPDFESQARDILNRIKQISTLTIANIPIGYAMEANIVRRMEERVEDSSKKGKKLSNDRDKLKRVPNVNIPYFN